MGKPNRNDANYRIEKPPLPNNDNNSEFSTYGGIKKYLTEYCKLSTIHGFQYIGQNRTVAEKIWWILMTGASLTVCIFMILQIYQKWIQSPVIVSFATKGTPIYNVPFPAVTICPTPKTNSSCIKFSEAAMKIRNEQELSDEQKESFDHISVLCIESEGYNLRDILDNYNVISTRGNKTFSEKFYQTLHKCNPFLESQVFVKWMGDEMHFKDVFQRIITDEGVCYTFNMFSRDQIYKNNTVQFADYHNATRRSDWVPQVGYREGSKLKTYPRRAIFSGATNSLEMMIALDEDNVDYRCKGAEQGIKVVLHLPHRVPMPKEEYFMIPFNRASSIVIYPTVVRTSERIRSYDPFKRNCYFPNEKELKYFKTYAYANCNLECKTNYTLKACGCVQFYMPRENSTPICGVGSLECIANAQTNMKVSAVTHKMKGMRMYSMNSFLKPRIDDAKIDQNEKSTHCNCLPPCTDVKYDAVVTPLAWNWVEHFKSIMRPEDMYDENMRRMMTHINLFFKETEITTTERNELYGPLDFLSNFGGLLGLFTGFSILSAIEIIYFCTLRICANWKIFGRWYGDDNI